MKKASTSNISGNIAIQLKTSMRCSTPLSLWNPASFACTDDISLHKSDASIIAKEAIHEQAQSHIQKHRDIGRTKIDLEATIFPFVSVT